MTWKVMWCSSSGNKDGKQGNNGEMFDSLTFASGCLQRCWDVWNPIDDRIRCTPLPLEEFRKLLFKWNKLITQFETQAQEIALHLKYCRNIGLLCPPSRWSPLHWQGGCLWHERRWKPHTTKTWSWKWNVILQCLNTLQKECILEYL